MPKPPKKAKTLPKSRQFKQSEAEISRRKKKLKKEISERKEKKYKNWKYKER